MHITNGLNQRGSQVTQGLNPSLSRVVASTSVGLEIIGVTLFPVTVLEFTSEGPQLVRPKLSQAECPVCDCGDTTVAFVSTGVLPQQDPTYLPRIKAFSRENTPGGLETEAYSPGQPDPQADPPFLASPVSPRACCTSVDAGTVWSRCGQ